MTRPGTGEIRHVHEKGQHLRDLEGRIIRSIGMVHDITERKRAEQAIRASLEEKDVLLEEIHHRVKNNLQVISSLVSLQADSLRDPHLREVFDDVRDRVRSMALVHEKLYQSENLAEVDFAEYAGSLLQQLVRAHRRVSKIAVKLDLHPVTLSVETAVPVGLILNELAVNALKHAFIRANGGELKVEVARETSGEVRMSVSDDGVGLPAGFDWRTTQSLGLQLVSMLASQVGAKVEVVSAPGAGTRFEVRFAPGGDPVPGRAPGSTGRPAALRA